MEVYLYCVNIGIGIVLHCICIVFVFSNKAIMSDMGMRVEGLNWADRMRRKAFALNEKLNPRGFPGRIIGNSWGLRQTRWGVE